MKYNLSGLVLEINGKPALQDGKTVSLNELCIQALCALDHEISGDEKMKRAVLAETLYKSRGVVDIPLEDAKRIKDTTGKFLSGIAIMQIWRILDKSEDDQKKR